MKIFKRLCICMTLLIVVVLCSPISALAADSDFEISYTQLPSKIAPLGGTIKIDLTVKNKVFPPITWISVDVLTDAYFNYIWVGSLASNASTTFSLSVPFAEADLDKDITINVYIQNDLDLSRDGKQTKTIKVESQENVFYTSGTVAPEKAHYYVGETVEIEDKFRNGLEIPAANVSVDYYHRVNGGSNIAYGIPIVFGTVAGGESVFNTFEYTFMPADIGEFRMGSKITYNVSGKGPYTEYNAAHDFIVEAAPTPTPTPSASPTPTPTPTLAPTNTPTMTLEAVSATPESSNTLQPSGEAANANTISNPLLIALVIIGGLLVVAIIIVIILLIKKSDKFS